MSADVGLRHTGVICQQRTVQTRIQQRSPYDGISKSVGESGRPAYLVVRCIKILRQWVAALGIDAVVWPFRDRGNNVSHGERNLGG